MLELGLPRLVVSRLWKLQSRYGEIVVQERYKDPATLRMYSWIENRRKPIEISF